MFDYYKDWTDLSEEAYQNKKEVAVATLMERLYRKFPEMQAHVIRTEAATAKTMERYLQTPEGTAYGFSQKPRQALLFRPGPRSTLKNLYYASAWTLPGDPPLLPEGRFYKRINIPRGLPEDLHDWYRRRNLYLICHYKPGEPFFSPALVPHLESRFRELAPLYYLLMEISAE